LPEYVLRVEAVNFDWSIFDTVDISTVRGGSLLVLNAIQQLGKELPSLMAGICSGLNILSTAASFGLFLVDANDCAAATALKKAVENYLAQSELVFPTGKLLPLSQATFVVDVIPVDGSLHDAVQQAHARNRWQQYQSPSLSLDWLKDDTAQNPCEIDKVRPAVEDVFKSIVLTKVSRSVSFRRQYGQWARQEFYEHEAGSDRNLSFVDDFEELAAAGNLARNQAPLSAREKIAVFYVDGNQFGKKALAALKSGGSSPDPYKHWSTAIREHHRTLLKQLLDKVQKDPAWQADRRIRLETLLWGGDEIRWVVPGWKGWELAEWFFSQQHSVTLDGKQVPLTYHGGLVFCHRNAPIRNIVSLTNSLGEIAKSAVGSNEHSLAYEVLESFDSIHSLETHRGRWLPITLSAAGAGKPADPLVLKPGSISAIWSDLRAIAACPDFPRRQLYMAAKAWRNGESLSAHVRKLEECQAAEAVRNFRNLIGNDCAWLHLSQMLPYTPF